MSVLPPSTELHGVVNQRTVTFSLPDVSTSNLTLCELAGV
jgi:hypothetical protein